MNRSSARRSVVVCILTVILVVVPRIHPQAADVPPEGAEFFEQKIRPVLVKHCYECHSAESKNVKGGLRLDTRAAVLAGGESGLIVVPRKINDSPILAALRYESFEMPPAGKLPERVIADFERWIMMGVPDPRAGEVVRPETPKIEFASAREFWSFKPPTRHQALAISNAKFVKKPHDSFVLARLNEADLKPSVRADRHTLARRLHLTLLGIPPTSEELDSFSSNSSPNSYDAMVDRVLASPHFGERMARLWLDISRYAEDQAHIVGNNGSLLYPNAYLYRDWVINAFNDDMPYDDFVRLQLAADLIAPKEQSQYVALGFVGLGPKYYRRNDPEVMADEWENHVDTLSRGLLGLTVACARCHDHKYDPIPTTDYYSLAGVFASISMFNRPINDKKEKNKNGEAKNPVDAVHIVKEAKPTDLNVQIRGDVKNKGEIVQRGFPQILSAGLHAKFNEGSGRRELAEQIVRRDNPLTARVIVNRVWGLLFGKPIVRTPSNFGTLGKPPTHPKLLDDLSVRFMENGWSIKWLCREIILSSTWQQRSDLKEAGQRADPSNRLLWRMNRRRLDVESWRDTILFSAGRLNRTVGGKSIDPTDPKETRRTVYSKVSRLDLNPMLAMFDFPDPNVHAGTRIETTTPLQKMFVLNSPFMVAQVDALAQRCLAVADEDSKRINWACQTLFGRGPTPEEQKLALEFLGDHDDKHTARWKQYAQVLLASNELLMID
ncbi:MAG: PSD1 and planctomycete cytochrome C domain-containing protein [Planctomycetaceae bacterium]|nr:PSD1 and planctomycete cytochrome C domain-containing protein [Planctomycetaceae bacterium]